jgi:lysophospholipase L1-like esterase
MIIEIEPNMDQITILCYGDSNTWGYVPQSDHTLPKARYPRDVRWPGVLQTLLGDKFYIIEEGLNSRTTNLDYAPPPDRNGKTYLAPCLYSHSPLDLVVLALGGNDTKTYFNRSAEQIKDGLAELVDIAQSSPYGSDMQRSPQVLITTCTIPFSFIEEAQDENGEKFMLGSVKKSHDLVGLYAQLAEEKGCHFLDLSEVVIPSKIDGVHYDESAHKKCAELMCEKIKTLFA